MKTSFSVSNAKKLHEKIVNTLVEEKKSDLQEAKLLAYYLMEYLYEIDKTAILLEKSIEYDELSLQDYLQRLIKGEPIQYLTQKAYFYGLELSVNEHTLIPRPETEELVELIIQRIGKKTPLRIADIGTGSACIPIALAKQLPDNQYFAIDISTNALEVAKSNAKKNNVRISFIEQDILTKNLLHIFPLHIIISNPPYICLNEKTTMNKSVTDYEPHTALFVANETPLLFYEKIALYGQDTLVGGGYLFFEINQLYGEAMRAMLLQKNYSHVEILKDLSGNDRFAVAIKP
jgi:release factor glutamine methyltransferase